MARQQSFHRICCRTGTAWHSKQSAVYAGTEQLGPERIAARGPDIRLEPQKALSLGMVIHELATNDAKYGKLTHADGRVSINWEMSTADVVIEWQEHDGRCVRLHRIWIVAAGGRNRLSLWRHRRDRL